MENGTIDTIDLIIYSITDDWVQESKTCSFLLLSKSMKKKKGVSFVSFESALYFNFMFNYIYSDFLTFWHSFIQNFSNFEHNYYMILQL